MFRSWLLIAFVAGVFGQIPAFGNSSSRFIEATSKVHYPRDRSVDFLHMVLDLSFDWERKWVGGDVTFTLTPLAEAVRKVTLDSADLKISSIRSGGSPLKFRMAGEKLYVDLGREVSPGEEFIFTVSYEGNPRKGLYFSGEEGNPDRPPHIWSQGESEDNHYWFPCYDYPNDRVTFESIFTVPDRMTAVGNGALQETTVDSLRGTRTFHYRQAIPAVTYLISVAIGEFDVVRDEYESIPVEYFVPRGTSRETVLRSFGLTPDMMKFFSERIGVPYPYEKYAQTTVSDFIFGGMENISATTMTLEILHPERVELESSSQGLVAHELAHQWWGDLLTCRDWSHAWL
ncbi:MAG: M1 family metallopeptidase, partial [Acidobacteria bacterium]|nr:M1 family metallopeptidase [Acidobacteriota bacterium]